VRTYGLMLAAFYGNTARSIISSIGTYPREGLSLQPKDKGRPKLERAPIQSAVNGPDGGIILAKAVSGFCSGLLVRVGN
jgi:hypothetical protein